MNPLLMLEERYLMPMLPEIDGRDVLDLGCGSGRWLSYLAARKPRCLRGIDTSSAMLYAASQKKLAGVELFRCAADSTPFADESLDLILSSFVLGYVEDVRRLGVETFRIARKGCDLFLTDMHPETQSRLGWKRSFREGNREVALESVTHSLEEIVETLTSLGWELLTAIEPEFGTSEQQVFVAMGRLKRFSEAAGHPAVSIMHFRKPALEQQENGQRRITIGGARCAFGASESEFVSINVEGDKVSQILSSRFSRIGKTCSDEIDLTGYMVAPGFVNAHDHLEFALFPRLGGGHYSNSSQWAADIHKRFADVIAIHRSVPKEVRLRWGGVRNLLCGVTTVCHHNPLDSELKREDFPVRVVREYGWAHSLAFDSDLRAARVGSPKGRPFIVHACEGIDRQSQEELFELDRIGALSADTVIVHGLSIDPDSAVLLRLRGASLVICPSSNHFLFGRVPDFTVLAEIDRIALGSDSPLTADGDLLDEARFAVDSCGIEPTRAWRMLTETPARVLRLRNAEGFIRASWRADLIAFRDAGCHSAERLPKLSAADIEFVMIGGHVHLASAAIMERLSAATRAGLEPLCVDERVRWVRAPVQQLLRQAEAILGKGHVRLGGKIVRIPTEEEIAYGA
jgi:cytosine/adenosine deaminase-related metal-dependent hydrolase/ubiquinone/menaquinone biosynthesis C-methylase UbiE